VGGGIVSCAILPSFTAPRTTGLSDKPPAMAQQQRHSLFEQAANSISRRDFLKALTSTACAAVLTPPWALPLDRWGQIQRVKVPATLMLHSKQRWWLREILRWLKAHGYVSVTYRQFLATIETGGYIPERSVILTIDDLSTEYINPAFPAMADLIEHEGFTGAFGVVTRATPQQAPQPWAYLRELASRGWQLDTHTCSHFVLPQCSDHQLEIEIVTSARMLAEGTGQSPISLILPYGAIHNYKTGGDDQRIFDRAAQANLRFVVGIAGGRFIEPPPLLVGQIRPYFVGRISPGKDTVEMGRWLERFWE
jgi:peptidoglycan/xylan/chitin deacetylase (PgdA/CDA1 family)